MKPLPRALFSLPDGTLSPTGPPGPLTQAGERRAHAGMFAVVETEVAVDTLRRAIADGAAGIALSGCKTGRDIQRLAVLLSVAEAQEGRAEGSTPILAFTDGILPAPLAAESLANKTPRLAALVWDHDALAKILGAVDDHSGNWTGAFAAARGAVLLAAAAAGIPAYDAASEREAESFAADCRRSRNDGFFGRVAKNELQVAMIEAIYAR